MFYVARIYKTLNPSIVSTCSNERNAHDMARILSEETGCEHVVLQCIAPIPIGMCPIPVANETTDLQA